jgi:DNA invertase Pin-like site-specific DNA recombinase
MAAVKETGAARMSGRPGRLGAAEQADLGAVIRRLRAAGVGWKAICAELKISRSQAWRYSRRAPTAQEIFAMKHRQACALGTSAPYPVIGRVSWGGEDGRDRRG